MKHITCVALIHLAFFILPIYNLAIAKTKRDNMFKYEKKIYRAVYAIGLAKLIGFGYLSILLYFLSYGYTTLTLYCTTTLMVAVFYLGMTLLKIHISIAYFKPYPLSHFIASHSIPSYTLGILMFTVMDYILFYFYYFVNLEWLLAV